MSICLCRKRSLKLEYFLIILSKCKHTWQQNCHFGRSAFLKNSCKQHFKNEFHSKLSQPCAVNYRFFYTSKNLHSGIGYKLKDNFKDCCSLLDVSEDCSIAELKEAYIKKAKLYHPDSQSSTADPNKFDQVREAYQTIKAKLEEHAALEGLYPEEEDEDDDEIFSTKLKPQHRQYLDKEGIGYGTTRERQKQYEQFRLSKAQNKVFIYKIKRLTPEGQNAMVAKDQRAARRNKISNTMDRIVEDLIQEAMSKGDFRDLAGAGKPLKNEQDTPYMDKITQKLNQILISESTQPEWIMLQKEIRNDLEECRRKLATELKHLGDQPYDGDDLNHFNFCTEQFHTTLNNINLKIDKFNLICPVLSKQMIPHQYTREREKVCKDPDRFLPLDFAVKAKIDKTKLHTYQAMDNVSMKQIWSDFKDIFRKPKSNE